MPLYKSFLTLITHSSTIQLFRYGMVGLFHNGMGYLLYLFLTYIGGEPKMIMTIGYIAGVTLSFLLNKSFTFSYEGSLLTSGIRYLIAHIAGYLINLAILVFFVDKLGYPHQIVQAVAILVVALFLFITFKLFVFRTINTEACSEKV